MHVQLGRDSEDSLCDSMTDGQVTLSQPPAWGVGMESTSPRIFWGMEITQAAPARLYGCLKVLFLSSFLFSAKLVCQGIQGERNTQCWGQPLCKSAQCGDGKNPYLRSEQRPEVTVDSLQNLPPTQAGRVKDTNQAKLYGHQGHHNQPSIISRGFIWSCYSSRAAHEQWFLRHH